MATTDANLLQKGDSQPFMERWGSKKNARLVVQDNLSRRGARDGHVCTGWPDSQDKEVILKGTAHPESEEWAVVSSLKVCAKEKDLFNGTNVHADILKKGLLEKNSYIGNTLLHMYAQCGELTKAEVVFEKLSERSIVSWNILMAGYDQHGYSALALDCFRRMQGQGLEPNAITFVCIMHACGNIRALERGEEISAEASKRDLLKQNVVVGTALVDMYVKCGLLTKAQEVFEELPVWNVVSWSTLIGGYVQHGQAKEALKCFERMQDEGFCPNAVTFVCILKACGSAQAIEKGKEIHNEVMRQGLFAKNVLIGTALVDMYAKCQELWKAQEVFDELPVRNLVTWNVLIAGYVEHGHDHKALNCFEWMQDEGHFPDVATFICILKACGSIGAIERGKEMHADISTQGLLAKSIVLGNVLLDMYAKCDMLLKAQEVFDELAERDVVSWNVLIRGYAQHGHNEEALKWYGQMCNKGLSPDAFTFMCILKACGSKGAGEMGEQIHAQLSKQGLLGKDMVLITALLDMYAKCGALAKAQEVFDELPVRDAICWSVLIAGYAQSGNPVEAVDCFELMQNEGLFPDAVTLVSILKVCCMLGAWKRGEEIHDRVSSRGLLETDTVLGTAMVDMYAKSGKLERAQEVFKKLSVRTTVSWNALISGFAQLGKTQEVFDMFEQMIGERVGPDQTTSVVLLASCNHAGLVNEGQMYLEAMTNIYNISPSLQHYNCMVDLLSRAGHISTAVHVMEWMPASDCFPSWVAVLSACEKWGNVEIGRRAFKHAIELNEEYAGPYVCMSNIYAAAGMQRELDQVLALRMEKGI